MMDMVAGKVEASYYFVKQMYSEGVREYNRCHSQVGSTFLNRIYSVCGKTLRSAIARDKWNGGKKDLRKSLMSVNRASRAR